MKKIVLSTLTILTLTTVANAKMFVEPVFYKEYTEKTLVLETIKVEELVGAGSYDAYELRVGSYIETKDVRAAAYGAIYNLPDKNDETGLKIGFKGSFPLENYPDLALSIGGNIGFGKQNMNGKTVHLSNGTTVLGYVFEGTKYEIDEKEPTDAIFTQDTWSMSYGLDLGLEYKITDNLILDVEASFLKRGHNVSYQIYGAYVQNNLTMWQDSYSIKAGLRYVFDWTLDTSSFSKDHIGSMSQPVNMGVFNNGRKY